MNIKPLLLFVMILAGSVLQSHANVRLPKLVGNNMVLQRDVTIPIWGWADPGEKVTVHFMKQKRTTTAGKDGKWHIDLKPVKAGGPYEMVIKGKNEIKLTNILIGDVWLASGQSNMEWTLASTVNNFKEEIAAANYPKIRLFTVENAVASRPLSDISGFEWQVCSPETIGNFSAVAYFFGRKLHQDLGIPIGLINSSWGGTPAEAWTDLESIKKFPRYAAEAQKLADSPIEIDEAIKEFNTKKAEWLEENGADRGYMANGKTWADPAVETKDWGTMTLPALWEQPGILPNYDGVVWFRKELVLTQEEANEPLVLHLARVDDEDITYFNGSEIGRTSVYDQLRVYSVPQELLKPGVNVITVRVNDTGGGGGIYSNPQELYAAIGTATKSLVGDWHYKTAIDTTGMPKSPLSFVPQNSPTTLYNAMIDPLIPYAIKGAIWYQGESNAPLAHEYEALFPAMINGWRQKWGHDFPFLYVQLANYMYDMEEPADYEWAELRDAQTKTLELPNTGMAVAIDIGDPNDIHPRNKQDVGKRLALAALGIAYDQDLVYSGPKFESATVEGDKIRVKFTHTGSGLTIKDRYGYIRGFAIAGADKKFMWAQGYLDGNDIILYNEKIKSPTEVRYNWSNNPDGNVYNKEGLPAIPFKSDHYKGITEGK